MLVLPSAAAVVTLYTGPAATPAWRPGTWMTHISGDSRIRAGADSRRPLRPFAQQCLAMRLSIRTTSFIANHQLLLIRTEVSAQETNRRCSVELLHGASAGCIAICEPGCT